MTPVQRVGRLRAKGWAMRRLQRRRSAGLRPEPASGLGLTAAAAIAGALRDPRGLLIVGTLVALAVML